MEEEIELERCAYCGMLLESPCDYPPPDYCEQAINKVFLKDLNAALRRQRGNYCYSNSGQLL